MSRATLAELREIVLDELDDQWVTPSEITDTLELDHGPSWYRVALILERLANDGLAELQTPGSTVRRFRRSRRPPTPTTIVRAADNSAQRVTGGCF